MAKMSIKSKLGVGLVCLLAFALLEQMGVIRCSYSRLVCMTSSSDSIKPAAGDFVSTVRVQQPLTRWLPFFKYGETVFFHTYQYPDGTGRVIERDATTRSRLYVIGFCSTSMYEKRAREPFEKVRKEYQKAAEQAIQRPANWLKTLRR